MTTMAAGTLSDTLQALVDARLDTIDRMLLGRVDRQDRLAIGREVESQIFDLLQRHDSEELDRDDVLAVLARLDPPEAYLPDDSTDEPGRPRPAAGPRTVRPSTVGQSQGRLDLVSGILGIISMAMVLVSCIFIFSSANANLVGTVIIFLIFGSIGLTFVISLLADVFAARVRLRGAWALVGLVTGILSLLVSGIGGLFLALTA